LSARGSFPSRDSLTASMTARATLRTSWKTAVSLSSASWLVALWIYHSRPRRIVVRGLVVLASFELVILAFGTIQRNIVWRTEESLWLDATTKSPDNGRGLMNYGVIQMNNGNYLVADEYFQRALRLTPNYAYLHVNLGVLRAAQGQPRDAERYFREALQDDARNPASYTYFARWLRSRGRTEEARVLAELALNLSPADADARVLVNDIQGER